MITFSVASEQYVILHEYYYNNTISTFNDNSNPNAEPKNDTYQAKRE